jgi:hypothetical protein
VRRGGRSPSLLADTHRVDHVEIVDLDSGEVALFWDRSPRDATLLARYLRADLAQLEAAEFLDRWRALDF